jgi:transposase
MEHSHFVGIDVSKAHLDVHVRPTGDSFRVSHDDSGFVTLLERLRSVAPSVVVLEATGGYEIPVAASLASAGLPVAVVNSRQIRDFARATGHLAKTDRWNGARSSSMRPAPSMRAGSNPVGRSNIVRGYGPRARSPFRFSDIFLTGSVRIGARTPTRPLFAPQ